MNYEKYSTNTTWEALAGFSRAIKVNNTVYTSGTTVTEEDLQNGVVTMEEQSLRCLEIIEDTLKYFNATKEDIVQTRIYIDDDDWEQAAISHKKFFGDLNPANTLVKAGIIGDGLKVEIEAIAVTGD
mgnify:CR=1 FL=1